MKRAVIYARFSSDQQREESIDAQVRACKEHIKRQGYMLTHIYKDEAKSGKSTAERDQYNAMLADAKESLFDVVIMHKIDRNARNEFDYFTFKRIMAQYDISYEYAAQSIDLSPEGQMMEGMLVNFAAYYSRNLAKETKKGLNENAYKAQFNGGTPPYGYDVDATKHYVINEHEAEAVRMIFRMYAEGKGYTVIARTLNEKGYRTKKGATWGKSSLYDILGNEKYIGVYTFNSVVKAPNGKRNTHGAPSDQLIRIEDAIPPIVDKLLFLAVQELRKHNKGCAMKYKARREYILTGKIFCGECGSAMNGHTVTKDGKQYAYYVCNRKERTASKCPMHCVDCDSIEKWILENITAKVMAPESLDVLAKKMSENYENDFNEHSKTLEGLKAERNKITNKIERMMDIIDEIEDNAIIIEKINTMSATLKKINDKISLIQKEKPLKLTQEQILEAFSQLKLSISDIHDIETKKILVNLFVKRIIVTRDKVSAVISTQNFADKMVPRTRAILWENCDWEMDVTHEELQAG